MTGAIILAGGQGTRYHRQKQFELLNGLEMWKHVYQKVTKVIEPANLVVVGVDIAGGRTRSQSVQIGLKHLSETCERVVVLEAARPLVTVEQIKKLVHDISKSTTFALPLVNTVIGRDGTYYNRNDFYDLLTPQAFDYKLLKQAYDTGKYTDTTDETVVMYMEYGIKPHFLVEGENLIKVTYQRDLEIIEKMLEKENKEQT